MTKLTTSYLANKIDGKLTGSDTVIHGIFTFLNHAKPGDVVIRHWIDEKGVEIARNRGVSCVVTQNPKGNAVKTAEKVDFPLIITPKIELANAFALRWAIENFAKGSIRVVVTGTNGKSTTTHMIQNILNHAGYNCYTNTDSKSEFNTLIDPVVSYQISRFKAKTRKPINAMVVEVSEVQGWMDKLMKDHAYLMTDAVKPDVLVLTNITMDHIGLINSIEETYTEIYGALTAVEKSCKNNYAVLNYDDPLLREMAGKIGTCPSIISHGSVEPDFKPDLTVKSDGIHHEDELFLKMEELPFKSKHFLQNTMAAIGACLALNIDINAIKDGILSYSPLNRRFSILYQEPLIIDDFAHNPDGITATIKSASEMSEGTLNILFAVRGSRGEVINRLNVEALASALQNIDHSLVITSSSEVVDELNTVHTSEIDVVRKVLTEHNLEHTFKEELEDALNYTLNMAKKEDTILLIGAQGMDPAKDILNRIKGPE
ncbi:MAG: Mur ligase family protein [Methanobacterium sp. ERen5]|nr:MAG: Mur ligase family protein [Methanobacterium sp. ERen5]